MLGCRFASLLHLQQHTVRASTICRLGPRHHRVAGRGSGGINNQYDRLKPRRVRDTWRVTALVDSGMLLCPPRIDDSMVDRSGDAATREFHITPTCMYGTHSTHHRDLPPLRFSHAHLQGSNQLHLLPDSLVLCHRAFHVYPDSPPNPPPMPGGADTTISVSHKRTTGIHVRH